MTDFNDLPSNVKTAAAMRLAGIISAVLAVSIALSCVIAWWVGIVLFLVLLAVIMIVSSRKDIIEYKKIENKE